MTYRLVGLFLIVGASWGNIDAQNVSLEMCQEQAKTNYPYVRQYELIEKTKAFSLSNASKAYLPQLGISGYAVMVSGIPTIALPNMPAQTPSKHQVAGVARVSGNMGWRCYARSKQNDRSGGKGRSLAK